MKNVCDSSTPASVRSSSVRARTEPFKSIFMTASPRSHGGGLRVDTAAAAAGCAIGRDKSALLACGSSRCAPRLPAANAPKSGFLMWFHSWFG